MKTITKLGCWIEEALKDQNYKELLKEEEDKMAKDKAGVGDKEGEDKVGSAPKQPISSVIMNMTVWMKKR